MKRISIPNLSNCSNESDLLDISNKIDKLTDMYGIIEVNWSDYIYEPSVNFRIAYGKNAIFIKYCVEEEFVRAENIVDNDMVCEDSCVEFFVSPVCGGIYYNFEFNCIGTCRVGVGTSRSDNLLIDTRIINKIRRVSTLGDKPFTEKKGSFKWELIAVVPLEIFIKHNINELQNKMFQANFYKCGDKLSKPHYLSWNRVETPNPDFHCPEFFGEIVFT